MNLNEFKNYPQLILFLLFIFFIKIDITYSFDECPKGMSDNDCCIDHCHADLEIYMIKTDGSRQYTCLCEGAAFPVRTQCPVSCQKERPKSKEGKITQEYRANKKEIMEELKRKEAEKINKEREERVAREKRDLEEKKLKAERAAIIKKWKDSAEGDGWKERAEAVKINPFRLPDNWNEFGENEITRLINSWKRSIIEMENKDLIVEVPKLSYVIDKVTQIGTMVNNFCQSNKTPYKVDEIIDIFSVVDIERVPKNCIPIQYEYYGGQQGQELVSGWKIVKATKENIAASKFTIPKPTINYYLPNEIIYDSVKPIEQSIPRGYKAIKYIYYGGQQNQEVSLET